MSFADLHRGREPFVLPNAWDVASALLLAEAGFPAIGTTSMGVNAAAGVPDGSATSPTLTMTLVRALSGRLSVPLTVDLEGGYSDDPGAVADLAVELVELGVAGINLKDGHRPAARHAAILRAVVAAAPGLFVNARTDTYWLGFGGLDETVDVLLRYRDAGASGVFVPGMTDAADVARVVETVGLPLNILWQDEVPPGVARVSTGSALYRHALASAVGFVTGTVPRLGYADLQTTLACG